MHSSFLKGARLRLCIGSAGVTLVAGSFGANAATYYVSQAAGNDGNGGYEFQCAMEILPWNVRLFGIRNTSPWGYRLLRPKQHLAGFRNWWDLPDRRRHLRRKLLGSGTSKAHLQATSAMDSGVVAFTDHPTVPTIFQGFNVDANGQVTSGVNINWAHWWLQNGATKRVQDCEVHNIWSKTSLNQYQYGLIISNHGGTGGYCENVEILNCVVHDTSRDGLCLYPGDENAQLPDQKHNGSRLRGLQYRTRSGLWGRVRNPYERLRGRCVCRIQLCP